MIDEQWLQWIKMEKVDGDKGRKRFELDSKMPKALKLEALRVWGNCAACGRKIHPFRDRQPPGNKRNPNHPRHIYVAVACPIGRRPYGNTGCSRGSEARAAYRQLELLVSGDGGG